MQPLIAPSSAVTPTASAVQWRLDGNRIHLSKEGSPIRMADLSEAEAAATAMRIVSAYHASHGDPEVTFHGTALHQMRDSKGEEWLMIDSNAQPLDDFNRACAEMSAIWQMRKTAKEPSPVLERSFLMGNYTKAQGGENACPCGHCRREMTAIAAPDAMFYSLPYMPQLVDEPLEIRPIDKRGQGSEPMILKLKVADLLPLPKVRLPDASWLGTMQMAEQKLHDAKLDTGLLSQVLDAIDGKPMGRSCTLEQINQAMVGAIEHAYVNVGAQADHIRAVAVRTADGSTYVLALPKDELSPSKPPATVAALMKAMNRRNVTDVYVMDYCPAQTQRVQQETKAGRVPTIDAFNGGELDRIHKHKPKGKSIAVHVLPFNDGTLNEQELMSGMNSGDVHDFYPYPYISPNAIASGAQPSAGRG